MRFSSLLAQGAFAPRRFRRFHTNAGAALATTVRVTSGILGDTTDLRTSAQVAGSTGFTQVFFVVFVTEGTNGRFGVAIEEAELAGGQFDDDSITVLL